MTHFNNELAVNSVTSPWLQQIKGSELFQTLSDLSFRLPDARRVHNGVIIYLPIRNPATAAELADNDAPAR
jgi:hypothetical protein